MLCSQHELTLRANGLLPVGTSESPGVTERLITRNPCQSLQTAEGRRGEDDSPVLPNLRGHFSMREIRASSAYRTLINVNK